MAGPFTETAPTARVRPVAVVDDLGDDAAVEGVLVLPRHIRRSGHPVQYDLANPRHLRSVYEQVLREGTEEDIRRYVRASKFDEVWEELYLPANVRAAWDPWVRAHEPRRSA